MKVIVNVYFVCHFARNYAAGRRHRGCCDGNYGVSLVPAYCLSKSLLKTSNKFIKNCPNYWYKYGFLIYINAI